METNRNTDRLFEKLREMPEEMPHEKIQQFVLAQAAIGIIPVTASKGLAGMSKLFLKFHLNTLAVMTTATSVTLISIFALVSHFHKSAEITNHKSLFKNKIVQSTLAPVLKLETDTPKTETKTTTANNSNSFYFTTIKTGKGTTNISITNTDDSVVTKVSGNGKDSTYAYAHSGNSGPTVFVFSDGDSQTASTDNNFSFDMNNYSLFLDKMNMDVTRQSDEWAKQAEEMAKQSEDMQKQSEDMQKQSEDMQKQSEDMAEQMTGMHTQSCHVNMAVCGPGANDSLVRKIGEALVADKLITDTKSYRFSIDGNSVKVNGKKMDKTVWEKYKEIIETNSHSKVNHKFKYELLKDGDNETINVSNYAD